VPHLNFMWHCKRLLGDIALATTPSMWWLLLLFSHLSMLYVLSSTDVDMTFSWVKLNGAGMNIFEPRTYVLLIFHYYLRVANCSI
jgi:hypothetical protein